MEKSINYDIVADLYDCYVKTDMDIGFYLDLCKDHIHILELMCGTGRVSLSLIQKGFRLTCVDYSEGMLDVFRAKVGENDCAEIICQDITRLEINKKFSLAFISFHSFSEITDIKKRKQAFERIINHLVPGGLFFCSLYNPDYRIRQADGELKLLGSFEMENGKSLVVSCQNFYSETEHSISGTQFYELYDSRGQCYMTEKRTLPICFSVIPREEMLEMAADTGVSVKGLYGDYNWNPYLRDSRFMNFLFQKT